MTLIERDRKYIWHPFTPQKDMADPVPIIRGEGSLLFDEDGNGYIDAISSWWVNLHGHAHPYIAEKIYRQALQLEQVIFAGFTHHPAVDLAERLLSLLPAGFERIFYSDNGSTSTEVALKMAVQYYWNRRGNTKEKSRKKIIAFKNAYHGDTFGAMSVSDRSVFTLAFHDLLFEVLFIDPPTEESLPSIVSLLEGQVTDVCAFIYEPLVQGAGGMKMYPPEAMNALLAFMKRNGIICIADEVMTGFGRTGKLFASNYLNVLPDIICLSKGLTGGTMALGVTACTHDIYEAYVTDDKKKTFFHGHSFTANPLACVAALASMDLLTQPGTMEKIGWIHRENVDFASMLQRQWTGDTLIKNLRTLGTILAFEISLGADEYLNDISSVVTNKCLAQGVYLRPLGNTLYIMPPYCISEEQLQKVYAVILETLAELKLRR